METNICKIKFRRGVEKDRKNIIPEEGEPIFTTDSHRLCIGDGETQGGIPITKTYFESDTDKSKIKGDFEYKGGNLYLYTSDDESVPVGGVASVEGKIGNGLESVNGAIQVKQGDGITVNENGVSVNPGIINAVNTITKLDTDVSALNSTAMKAPLAPIYNNAYAMYASINGKANIPIRIDDIKDTLQKVEGKNGVYTFDSNNTTVINKIKTKLNLPANVNIQSIGVNNGCVLNYDNSIKFDYTNATYISSCTAVTTGEGENIVTTYTLSTYEDIVPRFHVDSSGGTSGGTSSGDIADNSVTTQKIADGAVTESKLSEDLKGKINNSSSGTNINFNDIYPVGSIYMSVNSTNPSELFGGTWEQIKDRFLLGAGVGYAAGETGGEEKHTLTIDEMPAHSHKLVTAHSTPMLSDDKNNIIRSTNVNKYIAGNGTNGSSSFYTYVLLADNSNTTPSAGVSETVGKGKTIDIIPPYLAVYMWRRTK